MQTLNTTSSADSTESIDASSSTHADSAPSTLMLQLAAGDENAMQLCIEKYTRLVEFLARRHLRAGADLESAVQDAFLELWRSAALYDPSRGSESTFVTMIVRSSLRDSFRQELRRPQTTSQEDLHEAVRPASREPISSEDLAMLRAAFDSLEEGDRQTLRDAMHRGLTLNKIAACDNISLKTAQMNLRRALSQMRAALRSACPEEDLAVA